jgi:Domain of unknown function (DUF4424)
MRALLLLVTVVLAASRALANDSSSELAAGGLVLTRTDAIAMQREDLTLAPDQVTVRYEMRNDTGKPVTLRVAFPMPDVPVQTPAGKSLRGPDGKDIAYNVGLRDITDPNYLGFFVTADGKAISTETDIHAVLPDGRDIVKDLYRLGGWGLVLRPSFYEIDPTMKTIDANDVGPTIHQGLLALHAVEGDAKAAMPLWSTRVTLHWMQTFKPGVTIVEHRYRPVLGGMLVAPTAKDPGVIDVDHGTWTGSGSTDMAKDFCIAGETDAALRALYRSVVTADAHPDRYLGAATLGYILRTARNWAGPIGTFHLTIKNAAVPHADGVISIGTIAACTDFPLRETAPKQWEATVTNYVPTRDLRVMLLPAE